MSMTNQQALQHPFWENAHDAIKQLALTASTHSGREFDECYERMAQDVLRGVRPGRSLLSLGMSLVELEDLIAAVAPPAEDESSEQTGQKPLRMEDVDRDVAKMIPIEMMERLHLMPIRLNEAQRVEVASVNNNLIRRDRNELQAALGSEFDIYWTDETSITTCIELFANEESANTFGVDEFARSDESAGKNNYRQLTERTGHAASEQSGLLLQALLLKAAQLNASDIHVAATRLPSNELGYIARLRVDGDLQPLLDEHGNARVITKPVGDALVNRFVTVGDLDPNSNIPRSGRFEVELPNGTRYDLRIEVVPAYGYGLYVVCRLLGGSERLRGIEEIYPPDESNLAEQSRLVLSNMRAGGLFLVAGATGSGKSTYLAALMDYLNETDRNLITIEHPIEYRLSGVRQIQVNKPTMDFEHAIESSLRLDPDVIMIGELRSPETVKIAIQAAQTGHMVLSTVHVTDAASTASRFKNLDVNPADVSEVLKGVLAQHLVGTTCSHCARIGKSSEDCSYCGGTGWQGRAAVGELLVVTQEISDMIADRKSPHLIHAKGEYPVKAEHAGMLLAKNITTGDEVKRKLGLEAGLTAERIAQEHWETGRVERINFGR